MEPKFANPRAIPNNQVFILVKSLAAFILKGNSKMPVIPATPKVIPEKIGLSSLETYLNWAYLTNESRIPIPKNIIIGNKVVEI